MNLLLVTILYLILIIVEVINLIKKNNKKDLIIYLIFISLTFIVSLLLALGVKLPSFEKAIGKVLLTIIE